MFQESCWRPPLQSEGGTKVVEIVDVNVAFTQTKNKGIVNQKLINLMRKQRATALEHEPIY